MTNTYFSPSRFAQDVLLDPESPYSRAARLVGIAIARHVNTKPEGTRIYKSVGPSYGRLQRETGYGEDAVYRAVKELCDGPHPLFQKVRGRRDKGGKRLEPNTYVLVVPQSERRATVAATKPVAKVVVPEPPRVVQVDDDYDPEWPF